jgi:dTDP-4-dehydrorhamnose 3,5-epimerase
MPFTAVPLRLPDVILVKAERAEDDRGVFMETYAAEQFARMGIAANFVQDNQSRSRRSGTLRGLHFQKPPHAQAKLVRVLTGAIFDVAVDLREKSPTFGAWVSATLTAERGDQLFVPRGFAHGFCTLSDETVVAYKCDSEYAPDAEGGIHFADPTLAITWPVAPDTIILSARDKALPPFRGCYVFPESAP